MNVRFKKTQPRHSLAFSHFADISVVYRETEERKKKGKRKREKRGRRRRKGKRKKEKHQSASQLQVVGFVFQMLLHLMY